MNSNISAFPVDLAQYDQAFEPKYAYHDRLDKLPEGVYQFEILEAGYREVNINKPLVFIVVRVNGGEYNGMAYEHAWFISSQRGANACGADLRRLGLDTHQWTVANGRPFSVEIQRRPPELVGVCFRGVTSRDVDKNDAAKSYPRLTISNATRAQQSQPGNPIAAKAQPATNNVANNVPF
jgi:hypothetical protein